MSDRGGLRRIRPAGLRGCYHICQAKGPRMHRELPRRNQSPTRSSIAKILPQEGSTQRLRGYKRALDGRKHYDILYSEIYNNITTSRTTTELPR